MDQKKSTLYQIITFLTTESLRPLNSQKNHIIIQSEVEDEIEENIKEENLQREF